jgi:hypothetical protein
LSELINHYRPLDFVFFLSAAENSFATLTGMLMPDDLGGFQPWAIARIVLAWAGDLLGMVGSCL